MPKAAIFDLDGTLLDSVDLHAIAWHEAMAKFGHDVSFEQARSQIGKGGDKLIPVFLSAAEQQDHGKELDKWRGERFKTNYLPLVRPFSAVPDLLRCVRDAGLRIAIASSAKREELDKYLSIARIAELVDATTSSEEVDESKAGSRRVRDRPKEAEGRVREGGGDRRHSLRRNSSREGGCRNHRCPLWRVHGRLAAASGMRRGVSGACRAVRQL